MNAMTPDFANLLQGVVVFGVIIGAATFAAKRLKRS